MSCDAIAAVDSKYLRFSIVKSIAASVHVSFVPSDVER